VLRRLRRLVAVCVLFLLVLTTACDAHRGVSEVLERMNTVEFDNLLRQVSEDEGGLLCCSLIATLGRHAEGQQVIEDSKT
jgi:hypothetical protein